MHGDADAHVRSWQKPQKIDMHRPVGDDVELIVARQDPLLAPLDLELENRGQEVSRKDELVDVLEFDRDRLRVSSAPIDDGWNAPSSTHAPGRPLACPA